VTTARQESFAARLARLGFADPARAERLLADPALVGVIGPFNAQEGPDGGVISALADSADPSLALFGLVRLLEALQSGPARGLGDDAASSLAELRRELAEDSQVRRRLMAVLGSSAALGDHLARHPDHWVVLREQDTANSEDSGAQRDALTDPTMNDTKPSRGDGARNGDLPREAEPDALRAQLLRSVGADPQATVPIGALTVPAGTDALRVAYRRRLLSLAARDLSAADPLSVVQAVARELADLASATLEAALALARADLPAGSQGCRIAVLGMGKCGGRELNYVSDVDVIYVVEPVEGGDERAALATGARLAAGLGRICSAVTPEGTIWPVDANLRPEGKQGPLVRTLASHQAYYQRWAATWEFQALLKARVVAGDAALGQEYLDMIEPMVWAASERENFVEDVQAMRRRVEGTLHGRDADRQLKLGAGGLRDVEFSVQLLQLVHGRVDPRLRTPNTWLGLEALSTFGYVGRADAAEMDRAYRMLRALEHRIQLYRLQRTHVVPSDASDLRRLGRSFGFHKDPAAELTALWRKHALEVRRLHEKLFYRPLLTAAARLSTDEARLTPEAAKARLAALGYRDPEGAMRHLAALTAGVSRRAAIQRQLLAVMLEWFAEGADPDAGLLDFRRLSDTLGSTHWYLKMLRDTGAAAERLAHVLSSSQLVADLLQKGPEAVALLEGDAVLRRLPLEAMIASVRLGAARHEGDPVAAGMAARAVRRREMVRTAIADIVGLSDIHDVGHSLSDAAVAAVDGALVAAAAVVLPRYGGSLPTRLSIIAMGRLGGNELNYGSDADVLFVHKPLPDADPTQAQQAAMATFTELRRLLSVTGPEPGLEVDADLRPEGRQGPLVRSLGSYAEYYSRWSAPWEAQALVRARPIAGEIDLGQEYIDLIDPLRWSKGGPSEAAVREIRRIKARVESERLPRGADPHRHLKLGRGGLADIEWTVQLIQLQHAFEVPSLRTTSTLAALASEQSAGLVTSSDAEVLAEAWRFASRLRNAIMLWKGRPSDLPPTNFRDLDGVARLAGYPPASAGRMDDDYQRVTRRARNVVERLFYG
jgi:[glutamine synthetase] adenylyltransferase / [glutamine synthetase]-adenylyl-L-tyrosine phosphorylase